MPDAASDLEEDLALALARLEVLVALGRVVEREGHVDGHLELAVLEPAEDLVGTVVELGACARVVEQLRPADEGRLADETEHGEGGDGARGVAEGDEDAALRERADALRDTLVASPSTPKSTGRTHECDGADSVTSGERLALQHQPRCAWGFKMMPRAL